MLTAKELTGAPLISYVPKSRKLRKKISEPVGKEKTLLRQAEANGNVSTIINNNNKGAMEQQERRQRHASDHSQQQERFALPPSHFYAGQNLYHKLLQDHSQTNLQDFYRNPTFSVHRHAVLQSHQQQHQQQQHSIARHPISKSFDNLSDTFSVSSDESENFVPRIIRPRRRRKKEKVRSKTTGGAGGENEESCASCLGSEKQWLPTGLLSAESSFDSRSEGSGSSEEEVTINSLPVRRKLAPTLSVPAYITSYAGSDYSSMTSSSSGTSPPSSSTDQLFDSDSAPSSPSSSSSSSSSPPPRKPLLKQTKSTSCSYFRSPKVTQKGVGFPSAGGETGEVGPGRSRPLRKTHSWAPLTSYPASAQEFSLFSPGSSIDLLSGIRQNLSRLDLRSEEDD